MRLVDDQIHGTALVKISDYIWSRENYHYAIQCLTYKEGLQICNRDKQPEQGIIYVGINQIIENVFEGLTSPGPFIIIHHSNDRSFKEAMYAKKPNSVKSIYTINCEVNRPDVFAIPIGFATINGEDNIIKEIEREEKREVSTKLFVRYNHNNAGYTEERKASLPKLKAKPFAKVIERQIPVDEFLREIKAHRFTMSLRGHGADACRTWCAMALGSIPIVSSCTEMAHFTDMPLVICPPLDQLTEEFLDSVDVSGKSTERMRMSYWTKIIQDDKRRIFNGSC